MLALGLLAAGCSSAEDATTTTFAPELTTTTTVATTTTMPATTTTQAPTTTTTEAPATLAEVVAIAWDRRNADEDPNEEVFHIMYDLLVRDSENFEGEALDPQDALEAGELYCTAHEGFIDTFGIDMSVVDSNQSIEFMQSVYKRVRGPHALLISIAAAGSLCSRDVMRSTTEALEQASGAAEDG